MANSPDARLAMTTPTTTFAGEQRTASSASHYVLLSCAMNSRAGKLDGHGIRRQSPRKRATWGAKIGGDPPGRCQSQEVAVRRVAHIAADVYASAVISKLPA